MSGLLAEVVEDAFREIQEILARFGQNAAILTDVDSVERLIVDFGDHVCVDATGNSEYYIMRPDGSLEVESDEGSLSLPAVLELEQFIASIKAMQIDEVKPLSED